MKRLITRLALLLLPQIALAQLPPGFAKFEIAEELNPTDLAIAPDGRVFITEKDGLVRIVEAGQLLPDPFIFLAVEDFNEQGLGHIALDPDFPAQPFVYLYYTVPDNGGMSHNKVVRISAAGNFAVPGSEVVLYECDPSFGTVHNGGALVFGNDGKLYISTGDKARGDQVQSMNSDLGKVLRINPDGSIPTDNPYYSSNSGKYRAIYALGLRNPFSMAVQPETGRIFACDVGNASWEEVNDIVAGKNYGHPITEGLRTTEPAPANYQDPFYTYHHNAGCSVLGAAFSPEVGGTFPAAYNGKFFFADYCKGYIKMMNPENADIVEEFATDIDRPVAIAISPVHGFYFLARSGIGGGSEEDNTESEHGSLWKVIYTGSEAPFIYKQPKSAFRVDGEDFQLETKALGRAPLQYRWQKNGIDLGVPDTTILMLNAVSLADSNSAYRCIVSNLLGQDTSDEALLWVTSNQRPILEIISPAPDYLYKAGAFIPFSGIATDPETGPIDPAKTFWKIDFHHNDHLHPAMAPTSGLVADSFWVPTVGEPSANVWYRIHYTAQDEFGLSKSVTRDVFPFKTPVEVYCEEASISVNADGILGSTPFLFESVAGLERSLSIPSFLDIGDSVLIFGQWENGNKSTFRPFTTPETGVLSTTALYQKIPKANGFGLLGEYFNEKVQPFGFDEELLISRIDSLINFEWLEGSPEPGYVPIDGFTVRWTGQVVPYSDDTLTFHTLTDDGARLWVNDSLLVDEWHTQPGIPYSGSIFLKGGVKYPIRFDFLEAGGAATAKLMWSTSRMPKMPIPQRQLYPPPYLVPNSLHGFVWLDLDSDDQWTPGEQLISDAAVLVINNATETVVAATLTDSNGQYSFPVINSGIYAIRVLPPIELGSVAPGYGLSVSGKSAEITLEGEQYLELNFAYKTAHDTGATSPKFKPWKLSPNPTKGILYFRKKPLAFQDRFQILVFDASGKLCLEKTSPAYTWETELDLSALGSGVYIVWAGGFAKRVVVY